MSLEISLLKLRIHHLEQLLDTTLVTLKTYSPTLPLPQDPFNAIYKQLNQYTSNQLRKQIAALGRLEDKLTYQDTAYLIDLVIKPYIDKHSNYQGYLNHWDLSNVYGQYYRTIRLEISKPYQYSTTKITVDSLIEGEFFVYTVDQVDELELPIHYTLRLYQGILGDESRYHRYQFLDYDQASKVITTLIPDGMLIYTAKILDLNYRVEITRDTITWTVQTQHSTGQTYEWSYGLLEPYRYHQSSHFKQLPYRVRVEIIDFLRHFQKTINKQEDLSINRIWEIGPNRWESVYIADTVKEEQ